MSTFNKKNTKKKKHINNKFTKKNKNEIIKLNPNEKVAIITIYGDNGSHRYVEPKRKFIDFFANHPLSNKFDIFIIEQAKDLDKFNIGKLKNVGFDIATQKNPDYDYFIFTDIDAIPDKQLFPYYLKKINGFASLAIEGTRYMTRKESKKTNKQFFGMTCGINKKTFMRINGYPNNFWGWGGEDDSLGIRLNQTNSKYYEPKKGSIIDTEENTQKKQINVKDKVAYLQSENLMENVKMEKTMNEINIWKDNGLNTLHYKLIDTNKTEHKNINVYVVDLLKDQDLKIWETKPLTDDEYQKNKKNFTKFRTKNLNISNKNIKYY